ncbi:MAG: hypothetical protein HC882_00170 [Acidobacteria bacterium]|nr:hypothetical protein [Acidobacteriota bacterium]
MTLYFVDASHELRRLFSRSPGDDEFPHGFLPTYDYFLHQAQEFSEELKDHLQELNLARDVEIQLRAEVLPANDVDLLREINSRVPRLAAAMLAARSAPQASAREASRLLAEIGNEALDELRDRLKVIGKSIDERTRKRSIDKGKRARDKMRTWASSGDPAHWARSLRQAFRDIADLRAIIGENEPEDARDDVRAFIEQGWKCVDEAGGKEVGGDARGRGRGGINEGLSPEVIDEIRRVLAALSQSGPE